tara:strand:+ start:7554 stop:9545 length:1992 start_codon:yes stop_codon:yes gene_type:complete
MDILKQSVATGVPMTELMQQTQVAETPEQQQEGLRNQPEGTTMAFPESTGNFNTVGMDYPINIQKVSPQGDLVRSYENVPPGVENLPMGDDVGTVIETPANYQDGGFDAWREALPSNLRDTDTTTYNLRGAYEAGLTPTIAPDGKYHLQSVNPKTLEFLKASDHKSTKEEIAWFENQKNTKPLMGTPHPSTHKIVKDSSGYFGERSLKYVKKQEGNFKEEEVVDYGMLPEVTVTDRDPHRNKYNRNSLLTKVRENWSKNLDPLGYGNLKETFNTILQTGLGNQDPRVASVRESWPEYPDIQEKAEAGEEWAIERQDLLNMLMGESQKHGSIPVSNYKIKGDPTTYYTSPVTEKQLKEAIQDPSFGTKEEWKKHYDESGGKPTWIKHPYLDYSRVLGRYNTFLGEDDKGMYIDYSDTWDLNPLRDIKAINKKFGEPAVDKVMTTLGKKVLGFTPPKMRGRVYFQEGDFKEDNIVIQNAQKAADEKRDFGRLSKTWFPGDKEPSNFAGRIIDMLPASFKVKAMKAQMFLQDATGIKIPKGTPICYGNTCVQSTAKILKESGKWKGDIEQDNDSFAQNYASHGYKIVELGQQKPGDIVQFHKGTYDNPDWTHMGITKGDNRYFNDGYVDKPFHEKNEPTGRELFENSLNPLNTKAIGKQYYRYVDK